MTPDWPREFDRWLFLSGTSDSQFAAMVGCSRNAVSSWRHGERSPRDPAKVNEAIAERNYQISAALRLTPVA
jgi:transcriptional regulator with XRE-family HTH domain